MIRKIKTNDYEACESIIRNNWNYLDYDRSPENCEIFSELDLLGCLAESNYTDVYVDNGEVRGMLFGRIPGVKTGLSEKDQKRLKTAIESLEENKEGKLFLDYSNLYDKTNKSLLERSGLNGTAELVFFALDPEIKGRGIGTKLLSRFLGELKEAGVENCYVFTDSTCDYPFYSKRGFKRMGSERHSAKLRNDECIDFYIYKRAL